MAVGSWTGKITVKIGGGRTGESGFDGKDSKIDKIDFGVHQEHNGTKSTWKFRPPKEAFLW